MNSLTLAFKVVTPLLIYMLIGTFIRRAHIMRPDHFKALNRAIFRIFIPLALFFSIYNSDVRKVIDPPVYLVCEAGVLAAFFLIRAFIRRHVKDEEKVTATLIQGCFRSNFVLFGGAIAASLCDGEGVAMISALNAVIVPTFNILAVILFEKARGGAVSPAHLIIQIFKNPLVDAGLLGLLAALIGLPIPELIAQPLMTLGSAATPVALVSLGGLLSLNSALDHRRYLGMAAVIRLVILPGTMILLGSLLGFRGPQLVALLAVFGSPTAVASAPMAQAMGGAGALAGEIVAVTTVASIATIFCFVAVLSGVGLI